MMTEASNVYGKNMMQHNIRSGGHIFQPRRHLYKPVNPSGMEDTDQLTENAKRLVEIAIEQDEEAALLYIEVTVYLTGNL